MRKYNTTEGEWIKSNSTIAINGTIKTICDLFNKDISYMPNSAEASANALLIADAGNTIQLCDKLPSTLWEENQELLKILKGLLFEYRGLITKKDIFLEDEIFYKQANELINKIQNG